jgi:hypothetical protein
VVVQHSDFSGTHVLGGKPFGVTSRRRSGRTEIATTLLRLCALLSSLGYKLIFWSKCGEMTMSVASQDCESCSGDVTIKLGLVEYPHPCRNNRFSTQNSFRQYPTANVWHTMVQGIHFLPAR